MKMPAITRRSWNLHHALSVQNILMGAKTVGWVGRTVYTVGQAIQKSAGHEVMLLLRAGRSSTALVGAWIGTDLLLLSRLTSTES